MPTPAPKLYRILPVCVDLLTIAAYDFVVPLLSALLLSQSRWNHLLLLPGFVLLILGVVLIRSLPNYSLDEDKGPSVVAACLAFFIVIAYIWLYTSATNLGGSESNNEVWLTVIFFVYLFPFLMAFGGPQWKTERNTKSAIFIESASVAIVNYFTLLGAAVWFSFQATSEPENPVYATGISHLVLWAIMVMLFIVFFGLPRVYILKATGNRRGFFFYVVGIGIFMWNKVPAL